jgi:hypothetical protein
VKVLNMKESASPFTANVIKCLDWRCLTTKFDQLPAPRARRDNEGNVAWQGWLFRGHKRESYPLEPSIERANPNDWAAAEYRLLREFQAKAPMHMDPKTLPKASGKQRLSWLAIMQHYGYRRAFSTSRIHRAWRSISPSAIEVKMPLSMQKSGRWIWRN